MALCNAINWGLLGSIFMPFDQASQLIIIIILAGISSGSSLSLQSNLILSVTYSLIVIVPLSIWTFLQHDINYFYLGIALITYLFFNITSGWRGNALLTKSLYFQFENIILTETLEKEATHDPITDLFNRRYLNVTLPRELKRIIREKNSLCFVMLDVDHFKTINDTYGHNAGDEVLKAISCTLKKYFRESDIICRFGGDEFIISALNIEINSMITKLENICKELSNTRLKVDNVALPPITLSIGLSEAPRQAINMEDLITITDEALYTAKKNGRNRIVVAA